MYCPGALPMLELCNSAMVLIAKDCLALKPNYEFLTNSHDPICKDCTSPAQAFRLSDELIAF
jgi:hypothetical protein